MMTALRGGGVGGDNGECGTPLAGARASEREEVTERDADGRVVAIMRLSLARLVWLVPAYGRQMASVACNGRPPPAALNRHKPFLLD